MLSTINSNIYIDFRIVFKVDNNNTFYYQQMFINVILHVYQYNRITHNNHF